MLPPFADVPNAPSLLPSTVLTAEAAGTTATPHRTRGGAGGPASRPGTGRREHCDYLIVGAGFAGCVLAERLARGLHRRVLLVDRRDHIGGNAYDCLDSAGILVHRYGPHIFHTNSERVLGYLSRFTSWRPYEHRVLAQVDGQLLPIPINLTTLNRLYGLDLDPAGAAAFLAERATPGLEIKSSRDVVVSQIGEELYRKFFEGYTRKQWGVDASELDKAVTARVPTRTDADDRYFQDRFQCMPLHGYTAMFERMIDHPNIRFLPGTDYRDIRSMVDCDQLIYCGPVDEYFDHCYGRLPYRSLRFEHSTLDQEHLQPVAVVNYPAADVPFTRITEYKHLTGQTHARTSITREFPTDEGDPYYPIPAAKNAALYRQYEALAERTAGVTFTGRLGTYRYYNMDQVVAQSLALYGRIARGQAHAQAAAGRPSGRALAGSATGALRQTG